MSFTVKKHDGAGLGSIGAELGQQSSVAVMGGSAVSFAETSIQGGTVSPVAITPAQAEQATVQSGMSKKPIGPR